MARATRSGGNVDPGIKKRKRNSSPHEKPNKQSRTDQRGTVADSTLDGDDGQKILDVLEESDSLGLLDRVFPLSPSSSTTFSLRSLLEDSQRHSLSVFRTAIHNLRPLAAHPRSRPSETASQQLQFCTLALSLLDQASRHIPPLSSDQSFPSLLLPDYSESSEPPEPFFSTHRYALVQHLPSGQYWSSLNSERPSEPSLIPKDISTGHAELVSILPTPSLQQSSTPMSTLASYVSSKLHPKKPLPAQRRLTSASFLDYGPWAGFAPSFDHDCELVGRRELGQVLWYKHERKARGEAELREWMEGSHSIMDVGTLVHKPEHFDLQAEFDGILPPEDIQNLKAVLDNAELEKLVDELLHRNQRALIRLQELQIDRLTKQSASTPIDETSEEWQIAHGIMESLETITSLRPRTSNGDFLSVVPPISVLRKLHTTLAIESHPGWHGTLPSTRTTALCDDSTVKVRASSVSAVPAGNTVSASVSPAPTSVTPATSATVAPTTTPYAGYPYAYSAQQAQAYRPAGTAVASTSYTPYKTGSTSYYQNYLQGAAQQQQQYYGQQAYGIGATNQQPYAAYTNWFAHAQQYAASAAAANAVSTGRSTPQPSTAATAYSAYYQQQPVPATQQSQQRTAAAATTATTPAVANTVAMNKTVDPGGIGATGVWGSYTAGQQPTLPARSSATTAPSTAATTTPVANGYQQSYYGAYQVPQQQTQQQSTAR